MSFTSFLTDFNLVLIGLVASFGAGVVLSTKVKDFLRGIPAEARSAFSNIEAKVVTDMKQARADVIAKIPGAAPASKVPLPADAPIAKVAAPAAPAPAPAPAADPAPQAPTPQAV